MRSVWLFALLLVTDTSVAAPLSIQSSSFDNSLAPRSEDGNALSNSGTMDQRPSISLGGAAKLVTALTGGYLTFISLRSQRARDALATMLGLQQKNSNQRTSNGPGTQPREGVEPPSSSNDRLLAKIAREDERMAMDQDSTNNPSGDALTEDQRRIRDECHRIKYDQLSGPEKYTYLKDGPMKFLEEWDKVCGDPESAKEFVESNRRQNNEQNDTRRITEFNTFESVRVPQDLSSVLLTKLGAVVKSGQKLAEGRNSFVNLPGGDAVPLHFNPVP